MQLNKHGYCYRGDHFVYYCNPKKNEEAIAIKVKSLYRDKEGFFTVAKDNLPKEIKRRIFYLPTIKDVLEYLKQKKYIPKLESGKVHFEKISRLRPISNLNFMRYQNFGFLKITFLLIDHIRAGNSANYYSALLDKFSDPAALSKPTSKASLSIQEPAPELISIAALTSKINDTCASNPFLSKV